MKYAIVLLIVFASVLTGCKKKCEGGCGINYVCNDGQCQCKQWYEGANCDTPMSHKFAGTFAGLLYTNGSNPKPDTFTFLNTYYTDTMPNYLLYVVTDTGWIHFSYYTYDTTLWGITLTSSTQGYCGMSFGTPFESGIWNTGPCSITPDGTKITFQYSPLSYDKNTGWSTGIDSATKYNFVGMRL